MSQLILKNSIAGIVFAVSFASTSHVNAATYLYETDNPVDSDNNVGKIPAFFTTYNNVTKQLCFTSTIQKTNVPLINSFWLVLGNSPNPIKYYKKFAIFYSDSITGNLITYVFNGISIFKSWNWSGGFIDSFAGNLNVYHSIESVIASDINVNIPRMPVTYVNDDEPGSIPLFPAE